MITINEKTTISPHARVDKNRELLAIPEAARALYFPSADPIQQKKFAQFLTPPHVAELMASMFALRRKKVRVLDPGAGMGILTAAFVHRQLLRRVPPASLELTAFELDPSLLPSLHVTQEACQKACQDKHISCTAYIHNEDFIKYAANLLTSDLFSKTKPCYDAVIVNPPYGKLSTSSPSYQVLKNVSAESTNLYTAFLTLAIELLAENGELVAITPRSFCNGPYFKAFRQNLLHQMSILGIHAFDSRKAAFKHDRVLQETVILHAVKKKNATNTIYISSSSGESGETMTRCAHPLEEIISKTDPESFIHIPTASHPHNVRSRLSGLASNLATLGLQVSTGRVVDFRAKEQLLTDPFPNSAPLVYPCHFGGLFVHWPKKSRKPNAIHTCAQTTNLLIPTGIYVLIKRFSSKEERRRVVACIFNPEKVPGKLIGFENHLNYIHANGGSLDIPLAKGLWAYLNSTALDDYFRQFNGHTQVNATDLRNIPFPTADRLRDIGKRIGGDTLHQDEIDSILEAELKP